MVRSTLNIFDLDLDVSVAAQPPQDHSLHTPQQEARTVPP